MATGCHWRLLLLVTLHLGVPLAAAMPQLVMKPSTWRFKATYPDDWDVRVLPAMMDAVSSGAALLRIRDGVRPDLGRRTWAAIEYTTSIAPVEAAPSDMCTAEGVQLASRRARLSAKVDVRGLASGFGWAGLYLGVVDARGYEMGLDNMHDRPILNNPQSGVAARVYHVVINVPPNAAKLAYGLHLVGGSGSAIMSQVALEWVSENVPLTTGVGVPPLDKFVPPDFGSPGFGIPK